MLLLSLMIDHPNKLTGMTLNVIKGLIYPRCLIQEKSRKMNTKYSLLYNFVQKSETWKKFLIPQTHKEKEKRRKKKKKHNYLTNLSIFSIE